MAVCICCKMSNQRELDRNNQKPTNMKNSLKFSVAVTAAIALTGPVYATSVIHVTDVADGGSISNFQTSITGVGNAQTINEDGRSIVVGQGTSCPPSGGGTAEQSSITRSITANYTGGGTGSQLNFYFASDGFGPSSADFTASLNGQLFSGAGTGLPIIYSTWYASGSQLPTGANPIPAGAITLAPTSTNFPSGTFYSGLSTGGPVDSSSYTLGEDISLFGSASGTS